MGRKISVVILHNSEGKILLQHRSNDSRRAPSKWGFFGGGIEEGESSLDAVKRELIEELEYELKDPKFLLKRKIHEDDEMYIYSEKFDESKKLVLREGKGMGWHFLHELNKIDIIPHDLEIIDEVKDKI